MPRHEPVGMLRQPSKGRKVVVEPKGPIAFPGATERAEDRFGSDGDQPVRLHQMDGRLKLSTGNLGKPGAYAGIL